MRLDAADPAGSCPQEFVDYCGLSGPGGVQLGMGGAFLRLARVASFLQPSQAIYLEGKQCMYPSLVGFMVPHPISCLHCQCAAMASEGHWRLDPQAYGVDVGFWIPYCFLSVNLSSESTTSLICSAAGIRFRFHHC